MEEPKWLKVLLATDFFNICLPHNEQCNLFCLTCQNGAFCYASFSFHSDHQVIQVRKYNYQAVVRAADIEDVLDIEGVQGYCVASDMVLYLHKRPLPKNPSHCATKRFSYFCETCGKSISDSRFCCFCCKVRGMKKIKKEEEESLV